MSKIIQRLNSQESSACMQSIGSDAPSRHAETWDFLWLDDVNLLAFPVKLYSWY